MKTLALVAAVAACGHPEAAAPDPVPPTAAKLAVTSSAFAAGAEIPSEHTCEGADSAPPLAWSGAPASTQSFAIVVDAPDAPDPAKPQRVWVHCVRAQLSATVTSLPAQGGVDGNNDWNAPGWRGPCPPVGRHRYFFKVYALDAKIGDAGMTKAQLLKAMQGHVVAAGELIGTYQKHKQ